MEDRLSTLPDEITGLILSKIPIREAVRCCVLSRKWRYAYSYISTFKLSPLLLMGPVDNPREREWVEDAISQILRLHSSHGEGLHSSLVEAFHLSIDGHDQAWRFTAANVNRWVQYAASKNVQRITLCQSPQIEIPPPAAFFTCARLTTFKLSNYILSNIPDSCVRFNHLVSCSFDNVEFTDDSLALFISRCPLLQRLSINPSAGLLNPVITAPNITNLLIRDDGMKALTITCPKIITLELSCAVRSLEMKFTSSLVELCLVLQMNNEAPKFSAARLLDTVSNFQSLKELCINLFENLVGGQNPEMTLSFLKLLGMLPNLEVLHLGGIFALELDQDRIPECLSSPLANLRKVQVNIWNFGELETAVLGCLLQSSPALEIIEFQLIEEENIGKPQCRAFVENLYSLKRASTQGQRRFEWHSGYRVWIMS